MLNRCPKEEKRLPGGHSEYSRGPDKEPVWRSRFSDWLQAGRPTGQSSNPGSVKIFIFSTSSKLVLGPTQPPIQWLPISLRVKRPGPGADHSPPTSAEVKNGGTIPLPHMPSWHSP
jgi:hypothetical protein